MYKATAVLLFFVCVLPLSAQPDDAQALLEKALKAHGDEKAALKNPAMTAKGKGTLQLMDMAFDYTRKSGRMRLKKPNTTSTSTPTAPPLKSPARSTAKTPGPWSKAPSKIFPTTSSRKRAKIYTWNR